MTLGDGEVHSEGPLLIVADNYQLACNYAGERELGAERGGAWRYISQVHQAFGRRGGRYVVTTIGDLTPAQWDERRQILDVLRRNGFTRGGEPAH